MAQVLVIEDDPDLMMPVKLKLEKEGFTVLTAEDGKQGWDLTLNSEVDCIILDLVMPRTDGIWFLENLRNNPDKSKIPVIVFTNLAEGEKVAKVIALGAYRLLIKAETSLEVLVNTVKEVIRLYS